MAFVVFLEFSVD